MNFKKRRIRSNLKKAKQTISKSPETVSEMAENVIPPTSKSNSKHTRYLNLATIAAGAILIIGLFLVTVNIIKSLDFSSVVFSFGKELKKDAHNHTNFLLVGVGGVEHDGSDLTDTIIVASLDNKDKSVKMLSIPRDLYIDDKQTGGQRINKLYDTYLNKYDDSSKAMEKLGLLVTDLTGVPIHYTIKIDFNGFVKIVDALGGVTVDVENRIYDPNYPKGETIQYETFIIEPGVQELDGETALKYARSRKTTSDFDRAKRQQKLLSAIKEKALSLNLLTDPTKIQKLYNSIADSLETSLSVAEIIELAKIAKDINKDQIQSRVLSDDFTSCGGYLYTPVREYFGGQAVLLPAGNKFDEINRFGKNYFFGPAVSNAEIQVLNGTKTSGLALNYLNRLSRDCLNVVYYGNASSKEIKNTSIYYAPLTDEKGNKQIPGEIEAIKSTIDAPIIEGIPEEYLEGEKRLNSKIVIELGADYKSLTSKDPYDSLLYTTPVEPVETPENTPEKPINSTSSETLTSTSNSPVSSTSTTQADKTTVTTTP